MISLHFTTKDATHEAIRVKARQKKFHTAMAPRLGLSSLKFLKPAILEIKFHRNMYFHITLI